LRPRSRADNEFAFGISPFEFAPGVERLGELEGAVLDEFGIKATIRCEVDVFEEDAVHVRRDRRAGFAYVDGDDVR
jgi:hypothetical protein